MRRSVLLSVAGLLASCGVVGAPVPPESVGVAPTIERQDKQREALEAEQREDAEEPAPVLQGQDELLPPLQPVGTR